MFKDWYKNIIKGTQKQHETNAKLHAKIITVLSRTILCDWNLTKSFIGTFLL